MKPVICLFSRNLRLEDNRVVTEASASGAPVIPCFVFSSDCPGPFAGNVISQSLWELGIEISGRGGLLYRFSGSTVQVMLEISRQTGAEELFLEMDYTPEHYAVTASLKDFLKIHEIPNRTLTDPAAVLKQDGKPYQVFTPYLRKVRSMDPDPPERTVPGNWYTGAVKISGDIPSGFAGDTCITGGRSSGLKALENISSLDQYPLTRDIPSIQTSRLSAHLAFGTLSPREVFMASAARFGTESVFVSELIWRDFWYYIGFHYPHVFTGSFIRKYDALPWSSDEAAFARWCTGHTGFPIVDAGMRELNATGFMHNRVRMITASFLTKDLHIDWRKGERYFASQLVDIDTCVNNGNWQWSASTGCDAQPFFRIFNPWTQQVKFDPQASYIRKWVPELSGYSSREIHGHDSKPLPGYPEAMVDHKTERLAALAAYRSVQATEETFRKGAQT